MIIELEDGTKLEVADNATSDQIDDIVDDFYGSQGQQTQQLPSPDQFTPTQQPFEQPQPELQVSRFSDHPDQLGGALMAGKEKTWRDLPAAQDAGFFEGLRNDISYRFSSDEEAAQAIADRIGGKVVNIDGGVAIQDPSGQIGWVNKPGLDSNDIYRTADQLAASAIPATKAASPLLAASERVGLMKQIASGLIGTGALSAEKAIGGTFDPEEAGISAGIDVAVPGVLGAASGLINKARGGDRILNRIAKYRNVARDVGGIENPIISPSNVVEGGFGNRIRKMASDASVLPRESRQAGQAEEAVGNYVNRFTRMLQGGKIGEVEEAANKSLKNFLGEKGGEFKEGYDFARSAFGGEEFRPKGSVRAINKFLGEAKNPKIANTSPTFINRISEYRKALAPGTTFEDLMKNRSRIASDIKRFENSDIVSPEEVGYLKRIHSAMTQDMDNVVKNSGSQEIFDSWKDLNRQYADFMALKDSKVIKPALKNEGERSKLIKDMTNPNIDFNPFEKLYTGLDAEGKEAIKQSFMKRTFTAGSRGSNKVLKPEAFVTKVSEPEVYRRLEAMLSPKEMSDLNGFVDYLSAMPKKAEDGGIAAAWRVFANMKSAGTSTVLDAILGGGKKSDLGRLGRVVTESGKVGLRSAGNQDNTSEIEAILSGR